MTAPPADPSSERWAIAFGDEFAIKVWPDEPLAVVYSLHQRSTHLLDGLAAEVLADLSRGACSLGELTDAITERCEIELEGADLPMAIRHTLAALEGADLVCRQPR